MRNCNLILSLILSIICFVGYGQTDKEKIISAFDKIEYFPDSAIKIVYSMKKGVFHGYSIEFDSTGNAVFIGKYKKGRKDGIWSYDDSSWTSYKKGVRHNLTAIPGCGTGKREARDRFQALYQELINTDNSKRKGKRFTINRLQTARSAKFEADVELNPT